jgi:plastocyanin
MDRKVDRRHLLRASAVAMVGLAGCTDGGGDDTPTATESEMDASTDTETDVGTPTATEGGMGTPTATEGDVDTPTDTPTPTATEARTPTPQPDQRVTVAPGGSLEFDPSSFTVPAGDTVLWEWDGSGHNVVVESQPSGAEWPGDDADLYAAGHTHSYTFEVAGEYSYYCQPHRGSGMTGSFTVE